MALPAGVNVLGSFKGAKGDTGSLAFATAEKVAWTEEPDVQMVGTEDHRGAHFKIPLPLPGPETVNNDDATELLIVNPTKTRDALDASFVRADEIVINVSRFPTVQAAFDAAPDGARLYFPPEMSPVAVPPSSFQHKANNQTVDAMGVEFRVSTWGTPVFLALRSSLGVGANGHTWRIGLVRYVGVRGNHTGAPIRGSAPYCSGCAVWSNGDRNYVEYLRSIGMPTPIFYSSWDGSGPSDRMGVGNRIGYFEAEGYDFGLLFVRQEAYNWGNAYCHDDIDDSGGANPTHAIYGSAAAGATAGAGTIGTWLTRNHTGGNPYQFKYSHDITADRLLAERSAGVLSVQNCNGFTANLVSGVSLTPAIAGARMVEFVGVDACRRVHVGQIIVDKAQNTDSESVILIVNDVCDVGSISITARHSPSVVTSSAELSVRGIGVGKIGSVEVVTTGPAMRPVRLGSGTDAGRAVGWMLPSVRSVGAGAALDAIPVEEQIHCHSNWWGAGSGALAGAAPARGIFRRNMRWSNSAPSTGVPRGWTQTVNGALSGAAWAASTAVAAGTWLKLADNRVLRYITGGNTGATAPNPTTVGEVGADGTATWEYMSATSGAVVSEGNL